MDAVKRLLDRYGIADSTAGKAAGEFANAELQRLYDTLSVRGAASLEAALQVGVAVEKTDIADLQNHLGSTDNAQIERVFSNLLRGSQNHLRAFTGSLDGNCDCGGTGAQRGPGGGAQR
jgi:hypothetical protein